MSLAFRSLLLPAFLLGAVAVSLAAEASFLQRRDVVLLVSRIAFGLAFLLGWRFHRAQGALAALALAVTTELAFGELAGVGLPPETLRAVAVLLPLNLAVLAWMGAITLMSKRGLAALLLLMVQAVLVAPPSLGKVLQGMPEEATALAWMGALGSGRWRAAAFALAAAGLLVLFARRPGPLTAGWLGVLVSAALGLAHDEGLPYLGAAGLILLIALVEQAFSLAFEDGLTGLPGRRALDERLRSLSGPYALAMLDLDHFKGLNDRYGHDVGDQVLRRVAGQMRSVGGGGLPFRYGGEEFTIIFPGSTRQEARSHLEELREAIAGEPFVLRAPDRTKKKPKGKGSQGRGGSAKRTPHRTFQVTVSIGLAERGAQPRPAEEVLQAADKALYRAKQAGRNRLAATAR